MSPTSKCVAQRRRPPLLLVAAALALTYAELVVQADALDKYVLAVAQAATGPALAGGVRQAGYGASVR